MQPLSEVHTNTFPANGAIEDTYAYILGATGDILGGNSAGKEMWTDDIFGKQSFGVSWDHTPSLIKCTY